MHLRGVSWTMASSYEARHAPGLADIERSRIWVRLRVNRAVDMVASNLVLQQNKWTLKETQRVYTLVGHVCVASATVHMAHYWRARTQRQHSMRQLCCNEPSVVRLE